MKGSGVSIVIPAQAESMFKRGAKWIPAFVGMTN